MPTEPMLSFAEVAKPLFDDFKKCFPASHAVIVDLKKDIGTTSAKGAPSLTAKKNETEAQKQKRKEKIAVHVVKNLMSGKIDSLKKKIVAAMEPHADGIMRCFRTSKQIARFPEHLPFAKLAEGFRKQGTIIASMIMSTKDGTQLSQLLHGAAFYFLIAHFFDALAKEESGAAGRTGKKGAAPRTTATAPGQRTKKMTEKKDAAKTTVTDTKKRTAAKRTAAKRTAAKRTAAKRTAAKRTAAKRTAAKRTPAKRTAAKRTPAKRTAAKQ